MRTNRTPHLLCGFSRCLPRSPQDRNGSINRCHFGRPRPSQDAPQDHQDPLKTTPGHSQDSQDPPKTPHKSLLGPSGTVPRIENCPLDGPKLGPVVSFRDQQINPKLEVGHKMDPQFDVLLAMFLVPLGVLLASLLGPLGRPNRLQDRPASFQEPPTTPPGSSRMPLCALPEFLDGPNM